MNGESATLKRLGDQINWYDNKSKEAQCWFKTLKFIEIASAAIIPLVAVFRYSSAISAVLGSSIVIIEGMQQVNQYHHNWITYRSTCEYLRHEKYLYEAKAGPYSTVESPSILLAERVENLVSQEHAKWVSTQVAEKLGTPKKDHS